MSAVTARRVRAAVSLEALGKRQVKGLAAAVSVSRILWEEDDVLD